MRIVFLLLAALAGLTGCGRNTKPDAAPPTGYAAYVELVTKDRAAQQKRVEGIASTATSCAGDARCVEHVAAMAALASLAGGSGNAIAPPPAPPRELSGAEKFAQVVGALSPLAGTLVNGAVSMRQAQYSRDTARDQYAWLGNVVRDSTAAMGTVASTAVANARPSITVGGDYIAGDGNTTVRGQIGDTAGGDVVRGTQYQGPVAGRDQIGRDQITGSHVGDNDRYSSPGPYEGPYCTGDGCQPQPEPEP